MQSASDRNTAAQRDSSKHSNTSIEIKRKISLTKLHSIHGLDQLDTPLGEMPQIHCQAVQAFDVDPSEAYVSLPTITSDQIGLYSRDTYYFLKSMNYSPSSIFVQNTKDSAYQLMATALYYAPAVAHAVYQRIPGEACLSEIYGDMLVEIVNAANDVATSYGRPKGPFSGFPLLGQPEYRVDADVMALLGCAVQDAAMVTDRSIGFAASHMEYIAEGSRKSVEELRAMHATLGFAVGLEACPDSAIVFPFVFHQLKRDYGEGHSETMTAMVAGLHLFEKLRQKAEERDPVGYGALRWSKDDWAMMERVYGLYINNQVWTIYTLWWARKPGQTYRKRMSFATTEEISAHKESTLLRNCVSLFRILREGKERRMKCIQDLLTLATKEEDTVTREKRSPDLTTPVGEDPSSASGGAVFKKPRTEKKDTASSAHSGSQTRSYTAGHQLQEGSEPVEAHGFPSTWDCEGAPSPPPPWTHVTDGFERNIVVKQWWDHGGRKLSTLPPRSDASQVLRHPTEPHNRGGAS